MTDRAITIPPIRVTRTRAVLTLIGLLAVVAAIVTGCGNKFNQQFQDAARTGVVNTQPADIILEPDGFNNVATKCDHGNRLYISYHGNGSYGFGFAVPHDPTCAATTAAATRAAETAPPAAHVRLMARRCSQSVRVTHSSRGDTLTVYVRYCNRSYRAYAVTGTGQIRRSSWLAGTGTRTVLLSGTVHGGYDYEHTGGGTVHHHPSF